MADPLAAALHEAAPTPSRGLDVDHLWQRGRRRRRTRRVLVSATAAAVLAVGATTVAGSARPELGFDAAQQPAAQTRGSWRAIAPGPLSTRLVHGIWTGDEILYWGGIDEDRALLTEDDRPSPNVARYDGAAYDPATNTWRALPAAPLPGRDVTLGVGGAGGLLAVELEATPEATGRAVLARYSASEDTWRSVAPPPAELPILVSAWTGEEFLFWGRIVGDGVEDAGLAYDPSADTWRSLPPAPALSQPGAQHWSQNAGVWAGDRLLLWDGARALAYDPVSDAWETLPAPPLPAPDPSASGASGEVPLPPTVVWTGKEFVVANLYSLDSEHYGLAYAPAARSWRIIPIPPWEPSSTYSRVVMTDAGLLSWPDYPDISGHWGIWDPVANRWSRMTPGPETTGGSALTWTGRELVVWGARGDDSGPPNATAWRP